MHHDTTITRTILTASYFRIDFIMTSALFLHDILMFLAATHVFLILPRILASLWISYSSKVLLDEDAFVRLDFSVLFFWNDFVLVFGVMPMIFRYLF